jgi:hypothetical protein
MSDRVTSEFDVVAIDPGIGGTGVAKFHHGMPTLYEAFSPRKGETWDELLPDYVAEIEESIYTYLNGSGKKVAVFIEMPMFMQSTSGGTTARTGALVKLAMLTGAFFYACQEFNPHLVTPMRWKGNLSKIDTVRRITKRVREVGGPLPKPRMPNHVWDALGIGLYAYGKF